MHTGALLGKGFPILERAPVEPNGYLCHNTATPDTIYECSPEDFCNKPDIVYSVNYNNHLNYYNLYTQYDLVCKKKLATTLLNMTAFFSAFVGCTFLPRFADLFGRKKVFVAAVIAQAPAYAVLTGTHTLWVAYVAVFCFGLATIARLSGGFLLLMEVMPTRH